MTILRINVIIIAIFAICLNVKSWNKPVKKLAEDDAAGKPFEIEARVL